jgi:hypothetical protein
MCGREGAMAEECPASILGHALGLSFRRSCGWRAVMNTRTAEKIKAAHLVAEKVCVAVLA